MTSARDNYIINALAGQNTNEARLADRFGISIEDVEEIMSNADYTRCVVCDLWFENHEFVDDDGDVHDSCCHCRGGY